MYYRLTSVDGLGNPAGKEGGTIQTCRVRWPSLGDKGTSVATPVHTGPSIVFPTVNKVLAEWGVDHKNRGILIGLREREVNIVKPGPRTIVSSGHAAVRMDQALRERCPPLCEREHLGQPKRDGR